MFFEDNKFRNFEHDLNIFEIPEFNLYNQNLMMHHHHAQNNHDSMHNTNQPKLVSLQEGFLRGNLFANEYHPYKGMSYINIHPTNEKEKYLLPVYEYDFALQDLNLYLDMHPEDQDVYKYYQKISDEYHKAKKEYEKMFGPLNQSCTIHDQFEWSKDPWPWMKDGGHKHV